MYFVEHEKGEITKSLNISIFESFQLHNKASPAEVNHKVAQEKIIGFTEAS